MRVELVYVGLSEKSCQHLWVLEVAEGTVLKQAVENSDILQTCPEIPWPNCSVGIFGRKTDLFTVLSEGDRIEIYRPLRKKTQCTGSPKEKVNTHAKK